MHAIAHSSLPHHRQSCANSENAILAPLPAHPANHPHSPSAPLSPNRCLRPLVASTPCPLSQSVFPSTVGRCPQRRLHPPPPPCLTPLMSPRCPSPSIAVTHPVHRLLPPCPIAAVTFLCVLFAVFLCRRSLPFVAPLTFNSQLPGKQLPLETLSPRYSTPLFGAAAQVESVWQSKGHFLETPRLLLSIPDDHPCLAIVDKQKVKAKDDDEDKEQKQRETADEGRCTMVMETTRGQQGIQRS